MKFKHLLSQSSDEDEVIAYFGQGRLVKKLDGKMELIGGSSDDRIAAREWISLFFHEAVVRDAPGR